jgi:hypothetical protein
VPVTVAFPAPEETVIKLVEEVPLTVGVGVPLPVMVKLELPVLIHALPLHV